MTGVLDRVGSLLLSDAAKTIRRRERVLLALLLFGGRDGIAKPGAQQIAELSGLGLRDARRCLRELVDSGLVVIVTQGKGRGSTTVYQVAPNASASSYGDAIEVAKGGEGRPPSGTERVADGATVSDPKGGQGSPPFEGAKAEKGWRGAPLQPY